MGIFIAVFSYAASVIGAGFASGQEIISYFVSFGSMSIFGLLISAAIFGIFAYAVTDECIRYDVRSYDEYLRRIMPEDFSVAVKYFTLIFAVISFTAMAAGGGAMSEGLLGIGGFWGNAAVAGAAILILAVFGKNALKCNAALGAGIMIGIISCCLYLLAYREHQTFFNPARITASAISYAGYNLITTGPVLVSLSRGLKCRTDAVLTGIASAIAMLFAMLLMWAILSIYYGKIDLGELPMLTMAMRENVPITVIYAAMLFLAVLSTAVSSAAAAEEMLGRAMAFFVLAAAALLFYGISFTEFVNFAYRICGYIGIFITGYIILKKLKTREK